MNGLGYDVGNSFLSSYYPPPQKFRVLSNFNEMVGQGMQLSNSLLTQPGFVDPKVVVQHTCTNWGEKMYHKHISPGLPIFGFRDLTSDLDTDDLLTPAQFRIEMRNNIINQNNQFIQKLHQNSFLTLPNKTAIIQKIQNGKLIPFDIKLYEEQQIIEKGEITIECQKSHDKFVKSNENNIKMNPELVNKEHNIFNLELFSDESLNVYSLPIIARNWKWYGVAEKQAEGDEMMIDFNEDDLYNNLPIPICRYGTCEMVTISKDIKIGDRIFWVLTRPEGFIYPEIQFIYGQNIRECLLQISRKTLKESYLGHLNNEKGEISKRTINPLVKQTFQYMGRVVEIDDKINDKEEIIENMMRSNSVEGSYNAYTNISKIRIVLSA